MPLTVYVIESKYMDVVQLLDDICLSLTSRQGLVRRSHDINTNPLICIFPYFSLVLVRLHRKTKMLLLRCSLNCAVYCNRPCLFVCLFVVLYYSQRAVFASPLSAFSLKYASMCSYKSVIATERYNVVIYRFSFDPLIVSLD